MRKNTYKHNQEENEYHGKQHQYPKNNARYAPEQPNMFYSPHRQFQAGPSENIFLQNYQKQKFAERVLNSPQQNPKARHLCDSSNFDSQRVSQLRFMPSSPRERTLSFAAEMQNHIILLNQQLELFSRRNQELAINNSKLYQEHEGLLKEIEQRKKDFEQSVEMLKENIQLMQQTTLNVHTHQEQTIQRKSCFGSQNISFKSPPSRKFPKIEENYKISMNKSVSPRIKLHQQQSDNLGSSSRIEEMYFSVKRKLAEEQARNALLEQKVTYLTHLLNDKNDLIVELTEKYQSLLAKVQERNVDRQQYQQQEYEQQQIKSYVFQGSERSAMKQHEPYYDKNFGVSTTSRFNSSKKTPDQMTKSQQKPQQNKYEVNENYWKLIEYLMEERKANELNAIRNQEVDKIQQLLSRALERRQIQRHKTTTI